MMAPMTPWERADTIRFLRGQLVELEPHNWGGRLAEQIAHLERQISSCRRTGDRRGRAKEEGMKQEELFDLNKWKYELGNSFDDFEQLIFKLIAALKNQAEGAMEIGKLACGLIEKHGQKLWNAFLAEAKLPKRYINKCIKIYQKLKDYDIPLDLSMHALAMLASADEETIIEACDMFMDGKEWDEIQAHMEAKRKLQNQQGWIIENEEQVLRGLIAILEREGYEIETQVVVPNGLRVDLIAKKNGRVEIVAEVKYRLPITKMQQALGQTEAYSWNFDRIYGNPKRLIAFSVLPKEVAHLAEEAKDRGIEMLQIQVK